MFYFAYGSNLDRGAMQACCPGSKAVFAATLPNYQLFFTGWSRQWLGGTASIKRAGREKVLGGVYQLAPEDVAKLDRQQGYPAASDKIKVLVFKDTGTGVEAITYVARNQAKDSKPSPQYLKALQKGYIEWGLI